MDNMCCIMIDRNHCHRFACSIMLQLGSRAPIVIKWPAVVLVIWPHFNGNAQRRPRSASLGFAMFPSRVCSFLCTSNGYPRGKSNPPRGCQKIYAQIPCFLVSPHWRFFGLLACLALGPGSSFLGFNRRPAPASAPPARSRRRCNSEPLRKQTATQ